MEKPKLPPVEEPNELRVELRRLTRRAFALGGVAGLTGFAGWKWLGSRSVDAGLRWPLRRVLELDEKVARSTFDPRRLSRGYPSTLARMPRVNGSYGISPDLDLDAWRLTVQGPSGSKTLTIADVKVLPRVEVTTELRCIEGWSEIVTWAGARLSDLATTTGLANRTDRPADLLSYVALLTPNAQYFVGLDVASAFHPQTLLCYEMNGQPLTRSHGAPLRLAIPVKYGIKSLKQIGTIRFTDSRPADFWAARGYDWYAGL